MKLPSYSKFLNFVWYQGVWFTAILGREDYEWLLAALIAVHLLMCPDWRKETRLMAMCAALGIAADSALTLNGLYIFDPAPEVMPIPLWLMGLWLGFAGTLNHSLSYLVARPKLASVAALVAAPFSYFAGARFGAVTFALDPLPTAMTIGITWAFLIAIFTALANSKPPLVRPDARSVTAQ